MCQIYRDTVVVFPMFAHNPPNEAQGTHGARNTLGYLMLFAHFVSRSGLKASLILTMAMPGGTLADLERALCDPEGPMFWRHLLFYTEDEPWNPLDLQLPVAAFHSLVIKHRDVEAWLLPRLGKFLEAVQWKKCDPKSTFDVACKTARRVTADKAERMVMRS